jgi:hypothetical protein
VPGPFLSLSWLPDNNEVNNIPPLCPFPMMLLCDTGLIAMDPAYHGLKPLKAGVIINPSFPKLFSRVFCHSEENLRKIPLSCLSLSLSFLL